MHLPEIRRAKLKSMLDSSKFVRGIEAHNALAAGLIDLIEVEGKKFNALWMSSLTESASRGIPDNEYLNINSRLITLHEVMENSSLPIIYDADTGSFKEHLALTVKKLETLGVSAVVIEDKKGLKKNSLMGASPAQFLEDVDEFCDKIKAAKAAQKSSDFMLFARLESLILGAGEEDALKRAKAYVEAGADGIMIHSKSSSPDEVLSFAKKFDLNVPLMAVPSTYFNLTEKEAEAASINLIIYANQLLRSAYTAMKETVETILKDGNSAGVENKIATCKEIIQLKD